jgi:hypothetical protein
MASSKQFMTSVFQDIIKRFLNQSGNLRKLYMSDILKVNPDKVEQTADKVLMEKA